MNKQSRHCWLTCLRLALVLFPLAGTALSSPQNESLAPVWEDLRLGRWSAAEQRLQSLTTSPDIEVACQARWAEGNLWQFRRPESDLTKAATAYDWVVRQHPTNSVAPWALLALARIPDLDVLAPKPAAAIPLYRRVLTEYPESDAAQEAVLHLAEALWQAHGKDGAVEAVQELTRWRAEHSNPKYAAQIELMLGRLYRYPLEDHRAAVTHLAAAFDLGLALLPQRTSTCWTVATLAEHELHDRDLAIRYYTRFLQEFPNHRTSFMAKQGLRRLGALLPATKETVAR